MGHRHGGPTYRWTMSTHVAEHGLGRAREVLSWRGRVALSGQSLLAPVGSLPLGLGMELFRSSARQGRGRSRPCRLLGPNGAH